MTAEGWKELVIQAVEDFYRGDNTQLVLLSQLLEEQDQAKQSLRDKGFGCIGMPWQQTVDEVPVAR